MKVIHISQKEDSISQLHLAESQRPTNQIQCRICLEPLTQPTKIYCGCKGNLQNIHELCLLEWIKHTIITSPFRSHTQCQICKQKIYLKLQHTCHMTNLKNYCCQLFFCQEDKLCSLVLLIVIIVLIIILAIVISVYTQKNFDKISLTVVVCLAFIVLCSLVGYIMKYLIEYRKQVIGVLEKGSQWKFPSLRRIIPA